MIQDFSYFRLKQQQKNQLVPKFPKNNQQVAKNKYLNNFYEFYRTILQTCSLFANCLTNCNYRHILQHIAQQSFNDLKLFFYNEHFTYTYT